MLPTQPGPSLPGKIGTGWLASPSYQSWGHTRPVPRPAAPPVPFRKPFLRYTSMHHGLAAHQTDYDSLMLSRLAANRPPRAAFAPPGPHSHRPGHIRSVTKLAPLQRSRSAASFDYPGGDDAFMNSSTSAMSEYRRVYTAKPVKISEGMGLRSEEFVGVGQYPSLLLPR